MTMPLNRLLRGPATVALTAEALDPFLAEPGPAVVVFTGEVAQRPEAQDVAVVALELSRQVPGLRVGVVAAAAEAALMKRMAVTVVPTVLFIKGGQVKSTLARLQDWSVYSRTAQLLFGARGEPKS